VAKHRWKGAAKRNTYAVILTPKMGWVRCFHCGHEDIRLMPL
jgi:hypothetical protein